MDCKECIFAEWVTPNRTLIFNESDFVTGEMTPPPIQEGCECGRVKVLEGRGEAYKTGAKPYYELTKFCNMYRTEEWQEKQDELALEAARQEVMPLFGIAVYDQIDKKINDLQRTVDSILATNYQRNKIKVILSTFQDRGVSAVANIINNLQLEVKHSSAVFQLLGNDYIKDTEAFKKLAQATYLVKVKSGEEIPPDIFTEIDRSMNDDLERIVMFEGDGFSIISKKVVTDLYLEHMDYDKMVNHIRKISQEQNVYKKI
jgi:hypothetical protein